MSAQKLTWNDVRSGPSQRYVRDAIRKASPWFAEPDQVLESTSSLLSTADVTKLTIGFVQLLDTSCATMLSGVPGFSAELVNSETIKGPTDEFLDKVYELQQQGDIDSGIDYIFKIFNSWLYDREYGLCNLVLSQIDEKRLESDLLLAFLAITRAARDKLDSRSPYMARAYSRIEKLRGKSVAEKLLRHMAD